MNRLHQVTTPGTVSGITLKHPDGNTTLDVTATVVDKVFRDPDKKVVIGANNFTIRVAEVEKGLTPDDVKELAQAVATLNGFAIDREDIKIGDNSDIPAKEGV